MLACGLFPVDGAVTLQRSSVFFVPKLGTRAVHLLGRTTNPAGAWTTRQIRNLVIDPGERLTQVRFLIRDRAGQFRRILRCCPGRWWHPRGQDPSALPPGDCVAERVVRTPRAELTDRMLIFNQRHLHGVLATSIRHYNKRRPHRARDLRPPRPTHPVAELNQQRITRRPILGGLINEYERAA